MTERYARPLLLIGLGLAAAAGLGLALDVGPQSLLKVLALAGAVLSLGAQAVMFRLPEEREQE